MLEKLSDNVFLQFLLFPVIELNKDCNAIFIQRKKIFRSSLHLGAMLAGVGFCLYDVLKLHPQVLNFTVGILEASNLPLVLQKPLAITILVLLFAGITATIAKGMIKAFCSWYFGDSEFFLTEKHAHRLEKSFRAQGHRINASIIKQVVAYCVKQLRYSRPTIGSRPQDWRDILEQILYHENIDVFLAQRIALDTAEECLRQKIQLSDTCPLFGETWQIDKQTNTDICGIPQDLTVELGIPNSCIIHDIADYKANAENNCRRSKSPISGNNSIVSVNRSVRSSSNDSTSEKFMSQSHIARQVVYRFKLLREMNHQAKTSFQDLEVGSETSRNTHALTKSNNSITPI